jgi:glycosyltransferase involved in cell wall biosynthesis
VTCEWVDHPAQRHKLVAGPLGGLAVYRAHYGLGRGQWLRWRPTRGWIVDERARFGRFAGERALPAPGGLKILLVGSLGFNPERLMALEERGHQLYGLWLPHPEKWDTTGPLPYGNVEDIPFAPGWIERVRAIQPDVIYALLNWQAVPMIAEVAAAGLDIPMVYHFKEGPFICQEKGTWPALLRILDHSAGRIFISDEMFDWFQLATDGRFDPATVMILDGDLPKIDWLTDDWAPKLSAADGEIHTVCAGRPIGLDPFEALAAEGIHVHFYGEAFQQHTPNFIRAGLATGYMHLHPSVEPPDWVPELSRYDAGWFHVFDSYNGGDLRRAHWDDLNLAARLGTYAAAGLPWILKDTGAGRTSVGSLARRHDVGVFFRDFADLGRRLRDRPRIAAQTAHMRAARDQFAFDTHADALVAFFRAAIARHGARA